MPDFTDLQDWGDKDTLYMEMLRRNYDEAARRGVDPGGLLNKAPQEMMMGATPGDYLAAREYDNRRMQMLQDMEVGGADPTATGNALAEEFMNYLINRDEAVPMEQQPRNTPKSPSYLDAVRRVWGYRKEI